MTIDGAPVGEAQGRSLWQDARRRLLRNRPAVGAAMFLALVAVACIVGPLVTPNSAEAVQNSYVAVENRLAPYPTPDEIPDILEAVRRGSQVVDFAFTPGERGGGGVAEATIRFSRPEDPARLPRSFNRHDSIANTEIVEVLADDEVRLRMDIIQYQFYFGTDNNGRDLLARTLQGGRVSLAIGVIATLVSLVIGVAYGATAGYFGGRVDGLMMRFVDVMYSLPFIFFVILLMVVFGRNFILIFVAVGAVQWLDMARIVRGQTLSIKRREFIEAARATGVRTPRIIARHIVPNALGPVIVYMTLTVPQVILLESFLSFLGLGTQEPNTSWGVLIKEGADNMESSSWMLIFPALFLAGTLYCLNFLGDGLRDALDPKDR